MPLDTKLLDLDRAPTILEMRAFFKKHDWSAAKITEPKSRTTEEHTAISRIGRIMDAAFEQEAHKRGLPAWSGYLDHTVYMNGEKYQDNPLIALRDSVVDLVSDGVRMLLTRPDEIVEAIFSRFNFGDPDLDKKADDFMHTAVGTMLDVMQYDQLRQGKRTDLEQTDNCDSTSHPVGAKLRDNRTDEKLAENSNDSARQISRYIRLTYLVPELLQYVDEGKIGMRPAVEMSYLDEEVQRDIVDRIDESDGEVFPSHARMWRSTIPIRPATIPMLISC